MKKIDQISKIINKQKNGTFISVSWISDQSGESDDEFDNT